MDKARSSLVSLVYWREESMPKMLLGGPRIDAGLGTYNE